MSDQPQYDMDEIITVKLRRVDADRLTGFLSAVIDDWHAEDWNGRKGQKHRYEHAYNAIHKGLRKADRRAYRNRTGIYAGRPE